MENSERRTTGLFRLSKRVIQEFIADDMPTYAAALSYQVFFSLFPFILFLVALLGFLNIPGFFDWLVEQARAVLPGQATGVVEQAIGQIRNQAQGGLLTLGVVVALWTASAAVRMAMHALNVAYDLEEERPAWKKYPLSIFYTLLLVALIIVSVGLLLIGPQIATWLAQQIGLGSLFVTLWSWLRIPVAVLLLMGILALVYYLFPNTDQPFRFITPGAALAVVVWLAASLGFSFYVRNFADYSATYGSIGAIIVLLFYFFISAAVLLFGAELNAEVYRRAAESKEREGPDREQPGGS